MESFQEVMARVRAGDAQATRELFDKYSGLLFKIVRRYFHSAIRAQVDPADFVQEVWLSLLQNPAVMPYFETPQQFVNYLWSVARFKVIDGLRRGLTSSGYNVTRQISLASEPDSEGETPAHRETPSKSAIRRELKDVVLQGLRPAHQQVGMRILSGIEPSVIAKEYGLCQKTVERIRKRIVDKLQWQ